MQIFILKQSTFTGPWRWYIEDTVAFLTEFDIVAIYRKGCCGIAIACFEVFIEPCRREGFFGDAFAVHTD